MEKEGLSSKELLHFIQMNRSAGGCIRARRLPVLKYVRSIMKTFYIIFLTAVLACFSVSTAAPAADVNGLWTKTTSPDPNNITIFYNHESDVKAIGYSEIQGQKIVWYAEGEIEGKRLQLFYHHSQDALPPGWKSEGIMNLVISDDGKVISGTATSKSGSWSGKIEFKRIQLVTPSGD